MQGLIQGCSRDPLPTEFSSNPNQTHLRMLINVFRIIRKAQIGESDQGKLCRKVDLASQIWVSLV